MKQYKINKIGILTSGGDSPGMNTVIRAVVRAGIQSKMEVVGIKRGYNGLVHGEIISLSSRVVSDIMQLGGTFLYTARCLEFMQEEGRKKAWETVKKNKIDGLVVIGGDGSFRGAAELSALGIPTIGIPATIDNDIACSEYTIGFDTACNIGMEAVDRLRNTAQSHEKCSLIEVMGRKSGHLALEIGVAAGASAVLVPEKEYDLDKDICEKILKDSKNGKTHHIIIAAEGCKDDIADLAKAVEEKTGIGTRVTVLGHIQRGGVPTVLDRVIATRMGFHAAALLYHGIGDRIVAVKANHIVDYDINEGLDMKKTIDEKLYEVCQIVSC